MRLRHPLLALVLAVLFAPSMASGRDRQRRRRTRQRLLSQDCRRSTSATRCAGRSWAALTTSAPIPACSAAALSAAAGARSTSLSNSPGTFPYRCELHGAAMTGTITVAGARRESGHPAVQHREHLGQRGRRIEDDYGDPHRRRQRRGVGRLRNGKRQRNLPVGLHPDQQHPQLGRQRRQLQDLHRADHQRQHRGAQPVVLPSSSPERRRRRDDRFAQRHRR